MTDAAGPDSPEPEGSQSPVPGPGSPVSVFSLEGRAAPALYLVGWLGSLIGLALVTISVLAGGHAAAPWLFLVGVLLLGPSLVAAAGSQAVDRSRRADLAYRGPSPVLVFLAVVPLGALAVLIVLAPLSALGLDASSPAGQAIAVGMLALTYVGAIRLLVVGTGAMTWVDMGLRSTPTGALREMLLGAAFVVPVLVVAGIAALALSSVLPVPPSVLPAPTDAAGLAFNLIAAVILAPLGEEVFFRGFATTAWLRQVGPRQAVVRGSLFFAAAHVLSVSGPTAGAAAGFALFSFLAILPVAVTLGSLFVARRSLYAPLGLHATYNLVVSLAFLLPR